MNAQPDITASALVASARGLVGVKWKHQGRTVVGLDCIGLITVSMLNAGIDLAKKVGVSDRRNYGRNPSPELLERTERFCTRIYAPIPGSLIHFQFPGDKYPRHYGIYTDKGTVIHANAKAGRVVEHGYRMNWVKWTHSIWKLPGVSYE